MTVKFLNWRPSYYMVVAATILHWWPPTFTWRQPNYDRQLRKQHCMWPPWRLTPLGHHRYVFSLHCFTAYQTFLLWPLQILYTKRTLLQLIHYCKALSMVRYFNYILSKLLQNYVLLMISHAVKSCVIAWLQYQCTVPLNHKIKCFSILFTAWK